MAADSTIVTLTGTGVPHPSPGRAGAGVLVRHGAIALQFDAGRGTVGRLVDIGCRVHELNAVFITHAHSDHVVGLPDLVMTRWIQSTVHRSRPVPIIAVEGQATRFAGRMLESFADDIDLRVEHVQPAPPALDVRGFELPERPTEVWRSDDGAVVVDAVRVHHEPVHEAVAYRVTTQAGVVVISGDTRVCSEVLDLSRGADVVVHEACRASAMADAIAGTPLETIFDYHADTVALGEQMAGASIGHLVLTHLIPPPNDDQEIDAFAADIRAGGYRGPLTVGRDLFAIELPPRPSSPAGPARAIT